MQKITTFLWFNNNAEEAIKLYTSLFKNSKIVSITRYGDEVPGMKGKVLTAQFVLNDVEFMALDGGPQFPFTEAVSLFVSCEDQAEVDRLWKALIANGGSESMCGWLKDKFGLSWQIIPKKLPQLLMDKDPARASRAMQAMLKMHKIEVAKLEAAADGK